MSDSEARQEERIKNLRKGGLSLAEANRWVYGWSDPSMKTLWRDVIKSRPKGTPQFTQKETFKMILKTVFGSDYKQGQKIELSHASYLEIIDVAVEGILAGQVATRSIKLVKPTRSDLFHKARSEFKRLLQDDPEFKHIKHMKDQE